MYLHHFNQTNWSQVGLLSDGNITFSSFLITLFYKKKINKNFSFVYFTEIEMEMLSMMFWVLMSIFEITEMKRLYEAVHSVKNNTKRSLSLSQFFFFSKWFESVKENGSFFWFWEKKKVEQKSNKLRYNIGA